MRLDLLRVTGECAACGGPTDRPAWAEKSVCEDCGAPEQEQLEAPFVSPIDAWRPNGPRGSIDRFGFLLPGDGFSGELENDIELRAP